MVDGHVRNFNGHISRLVGAVPTAVQFEDQIRAKLRVADPDVHAWVTVENHTFNVELRASRPIASNVTLDTHGHRDERSQPAVKGRDFAWQTRASAASRREGADEGLLVDERGYAVSAIDASLLVLQGELVFHSTHQRTLPSVIEEPVLEYLGKQGATLKTRPEGFNIDLLRTAEVWLLDSFSGVRRVTGWLEYGSVISVPELRPIAAFIPTFSEVNEYLWSVAEEV